MQVGSGDTQEMTCVEVGGWGSGEGVWGVGRDGKYGEGESVCEGESRRLPLTSGERTLIGLCLID